MLDSTVVRMLRWSAVLVWSAVIFAGSSVPGSGLPGRFGQLAHFVEYAILATLLFLALHDGRGMLRTAVFALALASLYAITDEIHQSFVPMRTPDPLDWVVDTAGALFAVASCAAVVTVARRVRDQ